MSDKECLNIIFFDGVCNLCDDAVQFILHKDKANLFKFGSLQSTISKEILSKYGEESELDTFIYLRNGIILKRSTAALYVLYDLRFPWRLCSVFFIIPGFIRDACYNMISKYRYKIFGKKDSCLIPSKELQHKFIDA